MTETMTQANPATGNDLYHDANYVAQEWVTEGDGSFNTVLDKYTGAELARLPNATEAHMEAAIQAAHEVFPVFRQWSAGQRSTALERLTSLIEEHQEELAQLIMKEGGKPISYARNEIARCVTTVKTAAAETLRFGGETVPIDFDAGSGKLAFTTRHPIGPIACITPFNFPLNLVLHKVAPALAVGCPVIVKPAPQAPLSTMALATLVEMAGYPKGVFSAMVCDIPVAEKMVRDDRMAMLSFTGSDKIGWYLKSICGKKPVALELGGNAAVIIDQGSDLGTAAKLTAVGAFIYAGQVCISTQRIFAVGSAHDEFQDRLLKEIRKLKVGDPSDPDVLVGPIIDKGHLDRIESWVKEAADGGADVLCGGKVKDAEHNLFEPTLISGATGSMKVSCAEVFGPVAIIEHVTDFDQAIRRTNDSNYGLQAGVFTNDFAHVKQAHAELEVGGVMINNVPGFRIDSMPYGGVKDSGLGREGLKYAMDDMTEPRLLVY
jgi:acyl-CoA reductase-like NAD-dependent aldehyde dehydrogenase